jgi:hypothetical protein
MMTLTGSSACGQAAQAVTDCEYAACNACSDAAYSECAGNAHLDACASEWAAYIPACNNVPASQRATGACSPPRAGHGAGILDFLDPLRVACVALPP